MRYVLQVVLSNAQHPEYGQATIPFPIPNQNYDSTIELLGPLEIGDTLRQDCQVDELDSFYTVLNTLIGTQVTLDELDYLAKRLDSFCYAQEGAQFQGAAVSYNYSDMTDLINLTFSCQQVTVITDFSDLEQVGRDHYMVLNGGCASKEELDALDGYETALLLIDEGNGVITPYGVVYDNGMRLSQLYDRPASLFYLDPPYHATEGYYQNIGEDGFTETDHIRLRDALMRIEGKFLLSYNDDEFIRSLYDRPGIYLMETTRINNIKQRYDNGAQFPELIIANYDMHERLRVAPSQMNLFDLTGGDTAWLKS